MSDEAFSPTLSALSLPPMALRLRRGADGRVQIFDALRGRYVRLTPEEWVRQHFTSWLVGSLGYPAALLADEVSLRTGGAARRADTVLYDRRSGQPLMVVEYKAPCVRLTQRVLDQVVAYNRALRARYVVVSNGLEHYAFRMDSAAGGPELLPEVPPYAELISGR